MNNVIELIGNTPIVQINRLNPNKNVNRLATRGFLIYSRIFNMEAPLKAMIHIQIIQNLAELANTYFYGVIIP